MSPPTLWKNNTELLEHSFKAPENMALNLKNFFITLNNQELMSYKVLKKKHNEVLFINSIKQDLWTLTRLHGCGLIPFYRQRQNNPQNVIKILIQILLNPDWCRWLFLNQLYLLQTNERSTNKNNTEISEISRNVWQINIVVMQDLITRSKKLIKKM